MSLPDPEIPGYVEMMKARRAAIDTNLPSWSQVETACDSISSLAEAKAFLKKLSRVVYWLAKNSEA